MSNVLKMLMRGGGVSAPSDPNFNQTVLLLHGDGNQGANNFSNAGPTRYLAFSDNSANNFPITVQGDAYGDNFSPFSSTEGNWSVYFGGSGNYIRPPTNAAFSPGTGDFTIEAWINTPTLTGHLFDFRVSSGFQAMALYLQSTGRLTMWTGSNEVGNTGTPITVNAWNHVAFVRSSGTFTAYLNGVAQWSLSFGTSISNDLLTIASSFDGAGVFLGYMSNVRLVKGAAVYTSNFTPSTTPLTAISGTSVLTCQSNRFRDNSANNFAITVFGTSATRAVNPFTAVANNTDGSGYFDGAGGYLTAAATSSFDLGGGNFTVEGWFYVLSTTANPHLFQFSTSGTNRWNIYRNTNFYIFSSISGVNVNSNTGDAVPLNEWFHLAVVKSSTTTKIYLNGAEIYSDGRSYPTGNMALSMGFQEHSGFAADYLAGWVSNFRVVKGAAVYTAAFTPPTSRLTAITYTDLLICQYQGTVRNVGFIDSSPYDLPIVRTGNTTQGTFSPFSVGAGQWSNYFDGTGDYLTAASNNAFAFGTGDFTIEAWVYPTSTSSFRTIFSSRGAEASSVYFGLNNGTLFPILFNTSAVLTSSVAVTINAWNHVVLVRSSGTVTIYVNGVSGGSASNTTDYTGNACQIGIDISNVYPWFGYMSNLRVVKGTAVYTAAFTPSTTPLTAITNTSLLTCQSNRFVDNSTNAFAITRNGDVRVTPFSPFAPSAAYDPAVNGGSAYFDGTGDWLTPASDAALSTGNDNFTLEVWTYPTAFTGVMFDFRSGNPYYHPAFYTNSTGQLRVWDGNVEIGGTGTAATLNAWNHIAFVRSSNTLKAYLNGVEQWSSAFSPNMNSNALRIGSQYDNTSPWPGYMSGARLVKGATVYTTGFTPPTAPPTAIANTALLLNFVNAGILDQTGKTTLETVGNAQVNTIFKKYGLGSIKFDGTGDYLLVPHSVDHLLGTGKFTIEMWVNPGSIGLKAFIGKGVSGSTGWAVGIDSSGRVVFYYASSSFTSTNSISASTWTHIAVVRDGTGSNQTKIYINGTNNGTGTVSTDFTQTEAMYIGSGRGGNGLLNGYIDDLRITKGVARYTANFTPPAQAFPDT